MSMCTDSDDNISLDPTLAQPLHPRARYGEAKPHEPCLNVGDPSHHDHLVGEYVGVVIVVPESSTDNRSGRQRTNGGRQLFLYRYRHRPIVTTSSILVNT